MQLPDRTMWVHHDTNFRISAVGDALTQKIKVPAQELIGLGLDDLISAEQKSEFEKFRAQQEHVESSDTPIWRIQTGDGEPLYARIKTAPAPEEGTLQTLLEPTELSRTEQISTRMPYSVRIANRFLNHDVLAPLKMSRGALEMATESADADTRELLEIVMARLERISDDIESFAQVGLGALPPRLTSAGTLMSAGDRALARHFENTSFTMYAVDDLSIPSETLYAVIDSVMMRCSAKKLASRADVLLDVDSLNIVLTLQAEGTAPDAFAGRATSGTAKGTFLEEWTNVLLLRHGISLNLTWRAPE